MRAQDIGAEFEESFAEEMGLDLVPGSGSQWHSKLDVSGGGARWSLKATSHKSYSLKKEDLLEIQAACAETGEIGLMAIELDHFDDPIVAIVLDPNNFKQFAAGEFQFVLETKSDARRRRAHVPELLREEHDE